MHAHTTSSALDAHWLHGQLRGLALVSRAAAWMLAIIGFTRALRLIHSALVLGQAPWTGSLAASLLLTLGATFGTGALLVFTARALEDNPERARLRMAAVLVMGAAITLGTGAGGWLVATSAGEAGELWGALAWIGALGGVGAAARGLVLGRDANQQAGSLAWWTLSACWTALWVPMSAGWPGAALVAGFAVATLWKLWSARAVGWSVGVVVVTLGLDLMRGRESTFWAVASAFCAFIALSYLLDPIAERAHTQNDNEDEISTFQSIPLNVGLLLLAVVGVGLWCWATNAPWLWGGLFWAWRM